MDTIVTVTGIVGAGLCLFAFIMGNGNRWKNTDRRYDFANFLGSVLLLIYAIYFNSIPFIITNTVWGLVSLKDLLAKPRR